MSFANSYIRCSFRGFSFVVCIPTHLVDKAILSSNRLLQTVEMPLYDQEIYSSSPYIEGNKRYKLAYFLQHPSLWQHITKISSYGSIQSNAMLALSVLAHTLHRSFHYVVRYVPKDVISQPKGNLKKALAHGMQLHIDSTLYQRLVEKTYTPPVNEYLFGEGANSPHAGYGFRFLAEEIIAFCQTHKEGNHSIHHIFLPSGTGASAYHMATHIRNTGLNVLTTATYGDATDLLRGISLLGGDDVPPHVSILTTRKRYRFGGVYAELWELREELFQETGIWFDLLYDMVGWMSILEHPERMGYPFLYIHQGGMFGNRTLEERYAKKWNRIREKQQSRQSPHSHF